MLKQDYHMHCENSPDSKEPLEEMCKAAVAKGLSEIMVTDHYELFHDLDEPEEARSYHSGYMEQCMRTVQACQEQFGDRLYVGFGIELGQWHLQPETAAKIVREYPLDYVIASYHKMDDLDLKNYDYLHLDTEALCRRYLEGLLEIAQTGDFDCLGHMDLIKRYAASQQVEIRAEREEELVREILRTVIRREKGLELNTSGLRQAVGEAFPSLTILRWYREEGGHIITVGSDAHRREDVAAGFDKGLQILNAAGFTEITCFRKRKPIIKRIS